MTNYFRNIWIKKYYLHSLLRWLCYSMEGRCWLNHPEFTHADFVIVSDIYLNSNHFITVHCMCFESQQSRGIHVLTKNIQNIWYRALYQHLRENFELTLYCSYPKLFPMPSCLILLVNPGLIFYLNLHAMWVLYAWYAWKEHGAVLPVYQPRDLIPLNSSCWWILMWL